jgi:hypothetical protein
LGIEPPEVIQRKAAIEQASIDGDQRLVTSLQLQLVAWALEASDSPYISMDWLPGWEAYCRASC